MKIGLLVLNSITNLKKLLQQLIQCSSKDEKGASISLEDLKGKVVFINFWATWCSPCIAEIPTIQSLYEISKMMMRLSFYSGSRWQSGKKLKNYLMTKDLLFLYHSPMDIPRSFTKELYLLQ
jgi:thiol-disulfide isomerase/thioredoxin